MSDSMSIDALPQKFQEIVEDFQLSEPNERLELLLEYAKDLPPLPDHLQGNQQAMEAVPECQTPFSLASEVNEGRVTFYFDAPLEAPTTRGYASILAHGLNGTTPETILKLPSNFYMLMGLNQVISPQRLNGVTAIVNRMKRQMAEYLAAQS